MDEAPVREMLRQLGAALSEGDATTAASFWEAPALVLADDDSVPVASIAEVEAFFAKAVEWYRERGIPATRPDILRIEPVAELLVSADVRWPGFDADGNETWTETSHYILRRGDDGVYRVRVALTQPA